MLCKTHFEVFVHLYQKYGNAFFSLCYRQSYNNTGWLLAGRATDLVIVPQRLIVFKIIINDSVRIYSRVAGQKRRCLGLASDLHTFGGINKNMSATVVAYAAVVAVVGPGVCRGAT